MTITSSSQQSFGAKGEIDDLLSELAQLWPGGTIQPASAVSQNQSDNEQNQVLPIPAAAVCASTQPLVQNYIVNSPTAEDGVVVQYPPDFASDSTIVDAPAVTPEYMVQVTTAMQEDGSGNYLTQPGTPSTPALGIESVSDGLQVLNSNDYLANRQNGVQQNPWAAEPANQAYGKVANGLAQQPSTSRWALVGGTTATSHSVRNSIGHNPWDSPSEDTPEIVVAPKPPKAQSKRNRMRYNPWDLSTLEADQEAAPVEAIPSNAEQQATGEKHNPWSSDAEPIQSRGVQNGSLRSLRLPVVNGSPLRNPPTPANEADVLASFAPSSVQQPATYMPPSHYDSSQAQTERQSAIPSARVATAQVDYGSLLDITLPLLQVDISLGAAPEVVQSVILIDCLPSSTARFVQDETDPSLDITQPLSHVHIGDAPDAVQPLSYVETEELDTSPDMVAKDVRLDSDDSAPPVDSIRPEVAYVRSMLLDPAGPEPHAITCTVQSDPGTDYVFSDQKWRVTQGRNVQWSVVEGNLNEWPSRPDPTGQRERRSPVDQTPQPRQQQIPARMLQSTRGEATATHRQSVTARGSMVSSRTSSVELEDSQEAVMELLRGLPDSVLLTEPMNESLESMLQTERLSPALPMPKAPAVELSLQQQLDAELTNPANVETAKGTLSQEFTLSEMPGDVAQWLAELAEEIPVQDYPLLSFLPEPQPVIRSVIPGLSIDPDPKNVDLRPEAAVPHVEAALPQSPAPQVVPESYAESCSIPETQRDFAPGIGIEVSHYDGYADADHAESHYGPTDNRLGQLMVEMGLISCEQLEHCVRAATELSLPLGRVFVMSGWINGRQLQWSIQLQAFLKDGLITVDTCRAVADLMTCSGMTLKRALNCAGFSDAYNSIEQRATRLGDFLIEAGIVKAERYYEALYKSQALGIPVGRLLVISNLVSTQLLECALNTQRFVREGKISRQDAIVLLTRTADRHADQASRATRAGGTATPVPLRTMRLGELLSLSGILTEPQIDHALEIGLTSNLPIGRVLVDLQLLSGHTLEMALALQSLVSRDAIEPLDAAYALIDIHYHNLSMTAALEKNRSLSERRTLSFEQFIASLELISKEQIKEAVEIACRSPLFVSKALVFSGALAESTMQVALLCHFYLRESMLTAEEAMLLFNHCHKTGLSVDEAVAELNLQLRTLL
ncbi:MAG: hypothetical protein K2X93_26115 [Candidatus Obscuribacterales bacterium]|nr:hypothetical protein [Candidatus Obscuribacterales bacterium]